MFDLVVIEKTINGIVLGSNAPADPAVLAKQINDAIAAAAEPVNNTIATLKTSLTADEGVEASLVQRVGDVETALTDVVNHLAAGNTTAATETATAALPDTGNATTGASSSSTGDTASTGAASTAGTESDQAQKSSDE